MKIDGLISAVKAIRNLGQKAKLQVTPDPNGGYHLGFPEMPTILESKLLAQAIMRQGVREYLDDPRRFCERHGDPKSYDSTITLGEFMATK